jgi:O-antigen/teichoic acid export membrane protein
MGGLRAKLGRDRHKRDALLSSGSSLFVYGLSVLTGPLLGRALGPSGRGDLAAVMVPTQLFAWLATFGIPAATAYYARSHSRRELNMSAWVFTIVFGIPAVAIAWPFVPRFLADHDPVTITWFRLFLVSGLLILPQYSCLDYLNGRGKTIRFNALRHLSLLGYSACVIVLSLIGQLTLSSALKAGFICNVAGAAIAFSWAWGWPGRGFRFATLKQQLDYGWRVALGQVAQMVVGRLDQFVMVGLVDSRELGLYAVAVTAAGVSGAIGSGMALAVFPHVREAADAAARRQTLARGLRWIGMTSVGLGAVTALSAPWVIPMLFGGGFRGSLAPLWVLIPGQVCYDLANLISVALQAEGRPGASSRGLTLAALVTAGGIGFAVGQWGIVGAAAVTTASQAAYLLYVGLAVRRPAKGARLGPDADAAPDVELVPA